jgi:hypothetical protein
MEYGRAITFPLKDSSWLGKVGVGVLVSLVPIVNFAQAGYGLEVTRRVAGDDNEELPRWDDFGRYFSRGFGLGAAGFLWSLPLIALMMLLVFWGAGGAVTSAALGLRPSIGAPVLLMGLLVLLLSAVFALAFPIALIRYAITERWIAMFDFGWILRYIRQNLGRYLGLVAMLFLIGLAVGIVAAVLQILPLVGLLVSLVAGFWMVLVTDHLLGQLAREGQMVA